MGTLEKGFMMARRDKKALRKTAVSSSITFLIIIMSFVYTRRVQFYETDAQGVVHHSNYFRYFEEARGEFLRSRGYPYSRLRELGLEVILLSASCEYKKPLHYDEVFEIHLRLTELKRRTFSFGYEVYRGGELVSRASTRHCIVKDGKIVSIPDEVYRALS